MSIMFIKIFFIFFPLYTHVHSLARSLLDNKAFNKTSWSSIGSIFCLSGYSGLSQSGVDRVIEPLPVPDPIIAAAQKSIEIERQLQHHILHINDQTPLGYRVCDALQPAGLKLISTSLLKGDLSKLRLDDKYQVPIINS